MHLASIEKEIHNLKINKTSQSSDIPTKTINENVDIFGELLWKSINRSIKLPLFIHALNWQIRHLSTKKERKIKKITRDL